MTASKRFKVLPPAWPLRETLEGFGIRKPSGVCSPGLKLSRTPKRLNFEMKKVPKVSPVV